MKIHRTLQWLVVAATLPVLLACSPTAPVAGADAGRSPVGVHDPNVPAWTNDGTEGVGVAQGGYGPANSAHGPPAAQIQGDPRALGQTGMPNANYGSAPQVTPGFGRATSVNPAVGQDMSNLKNPVPAGANGGQWQGADPSQVQVMTLEQQAAFYQRAEAERSKVHDEIVQQIRKAEGE